MPLPTHRASDAEREETAERLRVAAGDGRLDHDELEERLEAAYSARTVGELAELTADLPMRPESPGAREAVLAGPDVRARLASFIVVNTICILIWALTDLGGYFWPIWVLLGTGVGLFAAVVRRALGVEEADEREHEPLGPPQAPGLPRR